MEFHNNSSDSFSVGVGGSSDSEFEMEASGNEPWKRTCGTNTDLLVDDRKCLTPYLHFHQNPRTFLNKNEKYEDDTINCPADSDSEDFRIVRSNLGYKFSDAWSVEDMNQNNFVIKSVLANFYKANKTVPNSSLPTVKLPRVDDTHNNLNSCPEQNSKWVKINRCTSCCSTNFREILIRQFRSPKVKASSCRDNSECVDDELKIKSGSGENPERDRLDADESLFLYSSSFHEYQNVEDTQTQAFSRNGKRKLVYGISGDYVVDGKLVDSDDEDENPVADFGGRKNNSEPKSKLAKVSFGNDEHESCSEWKNKNKDNLGPETNSYTPKPSTQPFEFQANAYSFDGITVTTDTSFQFAHETAYTEKVEPDNTLIFERSQSNFCGLPPTTNNVTDFVPISAVSSSPFASLKLNSTCQNDELPPIISENTDNSDLNLSPPFSIPNNANTDNNENETESEEYDWTAATGTNESTITIAIPSHPLTSAMSETEAEMQLCENNNFEIQNIPDPVTTSMGYGLNDNENRTSSSLQHVPTQNQGSFSFAENSKEPLLLLHCQTHSETQPPLVLGSAIPQTFCFNALDTPHQGEIRMPSLSLFQFQFGNPNVGVTGESVNRFWMASPTFSTPNQCPIQGFPSDNYRPIRKAVRRVKKNKP